MKKYWCIYRITNKINGKTYIGQHKVKSVLKEDYYMGSGKLINQAIKKYSEERVEYYRQRAIGNQWHKGHSQSEYCKKKVSEINKGRIPWNKDTKGVMKAWNKGDIGRLKWYNNGIKSVMREECPEGYVPGRIGWANNKSENKEDK